MPSSSATGRARPSATAWGFLAPAPLLLGLSVLIPAAMALVMGFTRSGLDVSEPLQFVGLANFRRLLADPMFFRVVGTTLLYLVGVVPPIVLGSLGLAVLANRPQPGMHCFRGPTAPSSGSARPWPPCPEPICTGTEKPPVLPAASRAISPWRCATVAPPSVPRRRGADWPG